MANGVQLATAYISLNVRTDSIKKQVEGALSGVGGQGRSIGSAIGSNIAAGIKNHMSSGSLSMSIFNPMEIAGVRWAVKAGAAIGGALKRAIVGAASLTGIGSIFAVGGVLTAGLDRLKTLQQSQVQLSLKLSPEEIRKVQNDIKNVVKGTPIPLDQAMQAVPRAISAGLRGSEVQQYIKDIADLTASTGGQAGFEQLAIILEQVRGNGKLAGDELNQLVQAGVDIKGILKETFGWDDKTLQKNLAKGKIGINEIQKAVQNSFGKDGGLAKKMGQTLEGATGNLRAAVARLGANFIAAIIGKKADQDPLKDYAIGLGKITDHLDKIGAWVDENRDGIHTVFKTAGDVIGWLGTQIGKIPALFSAAKNGAVSAANWVSQAWEKVTTTIGKVKDKVGEVVTSIKTKFTDIIGEVEKKFNLIFGPDGWFAQQFKKLGELVDKVRDVLGLGPATAGAATPGGSAPFNPGPMAPGAFGKYPSRSSLAPGTPLDGSDQKLVVVPNAALPGIYPGDQGILGQVKPGTYVSEPGVGDLTQGIGDCTSAIEDLIAIIEGRSTAGRSLATGNADAWLRQNGFVATDKPMPGSFQVGFFNDPNAPGGGHMQATLPGGTNFNWGDNASAANRGVGGSGAWGDPRFNKHYYKQYSSGGKVWGAGSSTSDSIPAMLSNGEHVLTASDVNKLGGQSGVYAFRNALQKGLIPGFAPGGPVDPNQIQDLQNNLADLNNQSLVAQQQYNEVFNNPDASDTDKLRAQINLSQALRAASQAAADYPIIASGGTAPDRSLQNRIYDTTDQLALAEQALKNLPEDALPSQRTSAQYSVDQARRLRQQAIDAANPQAQQTNYGNEFLRTLGFIPQSAGNTGVAGTSSLAQFIGMGNDIVGGVIDTGTSLAQTAVSAAITGAAAAGSFGSGAAAAPAASAAASYGIQLAGQTAKRLSSYGFQMAGIFADALVEQLTPFGTPRWLGYDYGQFAPQLNIAGAATSTLEKMGTDAINNHFANQGKPVDVPATPESGTNTDPSGPSAATTAPPQVFDPNQKILQQGDPGFYDPGMQIPLVDPNGAGGSGGGGSWARGGHVGIYDNGGVLRPGQLALNASRTPESILTKQQWNAMAAAASNQPTKGAPLVENLYAQDMQDAIRQLEKVKRRDMMQYAGRP